MFSALMARCLKQSGKKSEYYGLKIGIEKRILKDKQRI
jgi:hypothetical protein